MFVTWNFKAFIYDYLPLRLRTTKRIKWLHTLVSGVENLYNSLIERRNSAVFEMLHNAQRLSLEHLLNSVIQINGKPILLADADNLPEYYLYKDTEQTPNIFDTYSFSGVPVNYNPTELFLFSDTDDGSLENEIWLFTDDSSLTTINFYVFLDYTDIQHTELLVNLVNKYKLLGSNYKIILY